MSCDASHPAPRPVVPPGGAQEPIAFLEDAGRNLALVRAAGPRRPQYGQLVRQYRAVADSLGCRPALERLLRDLPRPGDDAVPAP